MAAQRRRSAGGSKILGTGLTFDKHTYEKANPFFYDAIYHLKEFGGNVNELMRRLIGTLRGKPQFTNEIPAKDGALHPSIHEGCQGGCH